MGKSAEPVGRLSGNFEAGPSQAAQSSEPEKCKTPMGDRYNIAYGFF